MLFGEEKLTFGARGANKHLARGSLQGQIFPYGRMSRFLASRRDSPRPPLGKILRTGLEVGEGDSAKFLKRGCGVVKIGKVFLK